MDIPPTKEPRPLTSEDWNNATKRAWKASKAEREKQAMIEWRKHHPERVAENARREKERNRDKRFTEEQQDVLKQLKERRTKESHFMVIEVMDNRNDVITKQDLEIMSKMIEIPENENQREIVTGVKQELVEPGTEIPMEIEDPPLPIERPIQVIEQKEVNVMEEKEQQKQEEEKQQEIEYGYTITVPIVDSFTSDKETTWDRTNIEQIRVRYVFVSGKELRLIITNTPQVKWKKVEKYVNGVNTKVWDTDRVFQNVTYKLVMVTPGSQYGPEDVVHLECDDEVFIEGIVEKERNGEFSTVRVTGAEERLWLSNTFKRDTVTGTGDITSTITISPTVFVTELGDEENQISVDKYLEMRKGIEDRLEKTKRYVDIVQETDQKYGSLARRLEKDKAKMIAISDQICKILMIPDELLNTEGITYPKDPNEPEGEKLIKRELLLKNTYNKEDLFTSYSNSGYKQNIVDELCKVTDEYYKLADTYSILSEETFPQWMETDYREVDYQTDKLKYFDRTLKGKKKRVPLTPFKMTVMIDNQSKDKKEGKEETRKLRVTLHLQSVEQQQAIEELFKEQLKYVVFRVDELNERDKKFLKQKFDEDDEKYKAWKAQQVTGQQPVEEPKEEVKEEIKEEIMEEVI